MVLGLWLNCVGGCVCEATKKRKKGVRLNREVLLLEDTYANTVQVIIAFTRKFESDMLQRKNQLRYMRRFGKQLTSTKASCISMSSSGSILPVSFKFARQSANLRLKLSMRSAVVSDKKK